MANDVIDNYSELNKLVVERDGIKKCLNGVGGIKYKNEYSGSIEVKCSSTPGSMVANLRDIKSVVGDRFDDLVTEFAQRVEFELLKKKEALDLEIERYEVVKRE